jgi:hypothetical protein
MKIHPVGFAAGVLGYFLWPVISVILQVLLFGGLVVWLITSHVEHAKAGAMAFVNMITQSEVYPLPMRLDDVRRAVKVVSLDTGVDRESQVTDHYYIFINTVTFRNPSPRRITKFEGRCTYISDYDGNRRKVTFQSIPVDLKPKETKTTTFEVRSDKLHDGGKGHVTDHFCQITEFTEFDLWPWFTTRSRK